ncbi:hypothetical protein GEMRC1_006300 [Eukaryota sp. GEM-RC1]
MSVSSDDATSMSVNYNKKRRSNAFRRKNMNKHQDVYNVFSYTSTKVDGKSVQLGPNGDYILISRPRDNSTDGLSISTNNDEFLSDLVQTQYLASQGAKVPDISSRFKKVYGMNAEENEDLSEFYSIAPNRTHIVKKKNKHLKEAKVVSKEATTPEPLTKSSRNSPVESAPSNPTENNEIQSSLGSLVSKTLGHQCGKEKPISGSDKRKKLEIKKLNITEPQPKKIVDVDSVVKTGHEAVTTLLANSKHSLDEKELELIFSAVASALRETTTPVIERAIRIAGDTTRDTASLIHHMRFKTHL